MTAEAWTVAELRVELERYQHELRAAGKAERTIETYIDRPRRFLDWLDGLYDPKSSPR